MVWFVSYSSLEAVLRCLYKFGGEEVLSVEQCASSLIKSVILLMVLVYRVCVIFSVVPIPTF